MAKHKAIVTEAEHPINGNAEVRDSERDIWSLGVMDQGSCQMGELLARHRRRCRRRHLELQVDIQARKLCLEFSHRILTHMRDITIL